jgi:hypothetical protein
LQRRPTPTRPVSVSRPFFLLHFRSRQEERERKKKLHASFLFNFNLSGYSFSLSTLLSFFSLLFPPSFLKVQLATVAKKGFLVRSSATSGRHFIAIPRRSPPLQQQHKKQHP